MYCKCYQNKKKKIVSFWEMTIKANFTEGKQRKLEVHFGQTKCKKSRYGVIKGHGYLGDYMPRNVHAMRID